MDNPLQDFTIKWKVKKNKKSKNTNQSSAVVNLGEDSETGIVPAGEEKLWSQLMQLSQDFKNMERDFTRAWSTMTRGNGRVRWDIGNKFFL